MSDSGQAGDDHAPGSTLSDPASLWPLVEALTHALAQDSREQAITIVNGATRELAMTRANLDSGPTWAVQDERQAEELRLAIDVLMQQFRSEFDRLEAEVERQQDGIAVLVPHLGQRITANRTTMDGPTEREQPDRALAADEQARATSLPESATEDPMPPLANPAPETQVPASGSDRDPLAAVPDPDRPPTAAPHITDQRTRWKANALVGAITLMVIVVILALIGAL